MRKGHKMQTKQRVAKVRSARAKAGAKPKVSKRDVQRLSQQAREAQAAAAVVREWAGRGLASPDGIVRPKVNQAKSADAYDRVMRGV